MKYVRTKDGRIIETPFATDLDAPYQFADTIEELCDEFVGIYHNICEVVLTKDNWDKYDIFCGAIWTDKGLIYVAKMNEKGELELI